MAVALLHRYWPLAELIAPPISYSGIVVLLMGIVVTAAAAGAFAKAGTPLVPFETSTVVVKTGLFRYTRNPMYLGMVIALTGIAILFGTLSGFFVLPFFVWIIQRQYIVPEEAFMEALFGEKYLSYKRSVRRWL